MRESLVDPAGRPEGNAELLRRSAARDPGATALVFGERSDSYAELWESVRAVVVLRPGASVDEAELRRFARQRLAGFKVPKPIVFQDALPKNPSGKILKRELRETVA